VDQDDLRNGWLLRKVFGSKRIVGNVDDEESAPSLGVSVDGHGRPQPQRTGSKGWGNRGISVSADEGVLQGESERQEGILGQESGAVDLALEAGEGDEDAKMRDPDELAGILEDDEDEDDALPSARVDGVQNGGEWRDGVRK